MRSLALAVLLVACKGGASDPDNAKSRAAQAQRASVTAIARALDTLDADHLILLDAIHDVANAKDDNARMRAVDMMNAHELIEAHDVANVDYQLGKLSALDNADTAKDLAAQADALVAKRKDLEAKLKTALAGDQTAAQKALHDFEDAQFHAARAEGARSAMAGTTAGTTTP